MSLQIAYPDTARVDHWQDWFDFGYQGTDLKWWKTSLKTLPSKDGSFSNGEQTRCVR